jgi:hypothetical protein
MTDNLAVKKIHKAMDSLNKALASIEKGDKRIAVGDLDFVKENAQEAIYILLAEIEDEENC